MSVRSGSKTGPQKENVPWTELMLESTALVVPVLPLLPFRFDLLTSFPTGIFLFGIGVEFLISRALSYLQWRRVLPGKTRRFLRYLNRVVIGLPLTIIYATGSPYGFLALFRIVPAGALVFRENKRASAIWFSLLFLIGSIFASMGEREGTGEDDIIIALFLFGMSILTILFLSWMRQQRLDHLIVLRTLRRQKEKTGPQSF